MDSHESNQEVKKSFSFDYDKHYKLLLVIPIILLLGSFVYLAVFYINTGDIVNKDVTLKGGVTLTIFDSDISIQELETALKSDFEDLVLRKLTDFTTGKQIAITIEADSEAEELRVATEAILGYELTTDNSSIEFTGSALGDSFYKQLLVSVLFAFIFMVIVIFIIFRAVLPSSYVVLSALMDIVVPLAIINFLGVRISTAGVAAFLMLIGYSVDTDILLTTRVLKRKEEVFNQRILGAFKTGLTMTLTSLAAVLVAYFLVISPALKQVFLVLSIGLVVDLVATWMMNASLLKWSEERKHRL